MWNKFGGDCAQCVLQKTHNFQCFSVFWDDFIFLFRVAECDESGGYFRLKK